MSFLPAMEWNAKWDWENLVLFNSKAIGSPKKVQPTDWGLEEGGDTMSFNLSGGGSGGSGSDVRLGSSVKSSASTTSSPNERIRTSKFTFEALEGFAGEVNTKKEFTRAELSGTSPPLEASVGSGEPFIGLGLGKRTYFENHCAGSNANHSSVPVIPVSSAATAKKAKPSSQVTPPPRCQVEGCNLDLSSAKEYHRKHRVCEIHSKCPKVVIGGLERRFCQQCSRFHSLSEFDQKKRSCRRRLSDHNARRRKPPQEAIQFNSTRLSSSFYDGRHQMSFESNNVPVGHSGSAANLTWESTCNSKFTLTKGCLYKPEKAENVDRLEHLPSIQLPHAVNSRSHDSNRLFSSKGPSAELFNQDLKDSTFSSNLDAAPDLRRALSLLSTNSWGSQPEPVNNPLHVDHYATPQPAMHTLPGDLLLSSSDYWEPKQQPTVSRGQTIPLAGDGSNHFQDTQLYKMPFVTNFYANPSN